MHVLVTGAAGWTAQSIIQALQQAGHKLHALDTVALAPEQSAQFQRVHIGDISDYQFVYEAVANMDVIVHLAVAVGQGDYGTPERPFQSNVQGTANIFEALRQRNQQTKVVLMSSAAFHVSPQQRQQLPYPTDNGDDFIYDFTKSLQEVIAHQYNQVFGIPVVALRAGHIVDGRAQVDPKQRPLATLQYGRGYWICRYDLAAAVLKASAYSQPDYEHFDIIGAEAARQDFDIQRTEDVLQHRNEVSFAAYT